MPRLNDTTGVSVDKTVGDIHTGLATHGAQTSPTFPGSSSLLVNQGWTARVQAITGQGREEPQQLPPAYSRGEPVPQRSSRHP
jgi:hypothetical protein